MNVEHTDVVIVGAGLSGIGAAYHLREKCPNHEFLILEGRSAIGGTWDLFRYPGIRSDSDMHTLGYSFKPWESAKAIADGPSILDYVRETATENKFADKIRFNHKLTSANWDSKTHRWTLSIVKAKTDETIEITCNFLYMCSGYYSYDQAHDPGLPATDTYRGTLVHPQFWPEDLNYEGKKVVVIGSGATAVTLVPSMAKKAASVTMLQRSPTYIVSRPSEDWFANGLRKLLPHRWAYALTRLINTRFQELLYKQTRKRPEKVKKTLLDLVRKELGPDYDVDKHFTPSYNPWDQRLCLVPDSDLFNSINNGSASVVTDHIDTFTETGIQLKSGDHLDADIIVTATGLQLIMMGGAEISVDGASVDFAKLWTYKGLMVSSVPNLVQTFGYINASWTLRADLTAEWVCKALNHMNETNTTSMVPEVPSELKEMPVRHWIDDFPAGYMQRVMHLFPKQGDREPWVNTQDFRRDRKIFNQALGTDSALQFTSKDTLNRKSA
ncbi:NAD(P)/FAD-dependent oxidoreductase [Porticoccaceae bacterium]|nr:NAD(P)/FAD-dependent oxidoreductase [Porticoccaceae bacterium]